MMTSTSDRMMSMTGMPSSMSGMMPSGMMPTGMMGSGMMPMMMPNMGGMTPRCMIKMEKTADGMSCTCTCEDKTSAMMLQNLCTMMQGQMFSCCMMMNGTCCCCCNMCMGMCTVEMTEMGCKMMCKSTDMMAVKMMHACCDCCTSMMTPGMMCCMMMGGMPVCCMMC